MPVFHIGTSDTTTARRKNSAGLRELQSSLSELRESGMTEQEFERFEREVMPLI